MAKLILMPQMGISEESAILTQWYVQKGDTVNAGDKLFSIETGKSAFDIEADSSGTVLELLVSEGDEALIKAPVCALGAPGESYVPEGGGEKTEVKEEKTEVKAEKAEVEEEKAEVRGPVASAPSAPFAAGVSPRARALAGKADADPYQAVPTGPEGRIIERDIRRLLETGAAKKLEAAQDAAHQAAMVIGSADGPTAVFLTGQTGAAFEDVPHSRIRKAIARNMHQSLTNSAQLTHHHSFDASVLQAVRARCKQSHLESVRNITLGDLILFAAARTLVSHRDLNAHYNDEFLRRFTHVNLGVAVDTPRGLMVPAVAMADVKTAAQISAEVRTLADGCRKGIIDADAAAAATFTVSNLGNLGVEMFTPVINPPQTGILGVCGITTRVKPDGTPYPAMGLSLSYDHRAVDGAPASRFMRDLCVNLENIDTLVLQ